MGAYFDALNIAPQLGVVMTRMYVTVARMLGVDLREWEKEVYDGGEWKRWGTELHAIELGGHYHFNTLPAKLTSWSYTFVEEAVHALLDYFNGHFFPRA